ncbi:MAG: type B 50S ribosomal protein L31 [Deltaproteobacteria bacterium]|nr:type B 50S ribosomal protein L31 [Deltaproteobacteria bacterium]
MKKDIHPNLHPVVFVDVSCGEEFPTYSTLTSDETKEIDGVEHYVIKVEISSASHNFYTGRQILVDTAGRVERFRRRYAKAEQASK